jgi:pimeloyl-ACP methyl ester carboxylesterase
MNTSVADRKFEDRTLMAGGIHARFWSLGDRGSPVILIHGLGGSAEIWMHNIEALAQQHRVYAPDLPGFGRSEKPASPFTPSGYNSFIDDFRKALNVDRVSLIGQSLGGGIALQYAIQFPEKVDKLVLVDGAGLGKEVIWTLRLMSLPLIGELISHPSRIGVALFFKLAVRNTKLITRDFVNLYYEFFTQPGFSAFLLKVVRKFVDIHGAKEEFLAPIMENLSRIIQPTLIIWGENDRVLPIRHAYYGKEKIVNSHLHIIKQCGHIPNFERADEFNKLVLDFLSG